MKDVLATTLAGFDCGMTNTSEALDNSALTLEREAPFAMTVVVVLAIVVVIVLVVVVDVVPFAVTSPACSRQPSSSKTAPVNRRTATKK